MISDLHGLIHTGLIDRQCTDYNASMEFVDKVNVKDKTFLSYDGWYHKCEYYFSRIVFSFS